MKFRNQRHQELWSVLSAGNTGATINGNTLKATVGGSATIRATVADGESHDITVTFVSVDELDVGVAPVTITKKDENTVTVTYPGFDGGSKDYPVGYPITIIGTSTTNTITINSGTPTVVLDNVSITAKDPVLIKSGAYVNLNLTGSNTLTGSQSAGLAVSGGATVVIDGPGSLNATGGNHPTLAGSAGIGGSTSVKETKSGTIIINGGTITATGGKGAAGIGSIPWYCTFTRIEINGGTITAKGGNISGAGGGAGIGDGYYASANTTSIVLTGGTIKATRGGSGAVAIGNGCNSKATITINNGADNGNLGVNSTVTNVFTAGDITVTTTSAQAGGIAGECVGSVLTNCYTTYDCLTTNAGTVNNCYY